MPSTDAPDAEGGEAVGQTLWLKREGEHRVLALRATDPEGRPVTLGVDGAEALFEATQREAVEKVVELGLPVIHMHVLHITFLSITLSPNPPKTSKDETKHSQA